ncbi:MAG: alternate F1F0 ATPase, F1 subunit alpha [Nitrospirota bacterium]
MTRMQGKESPGNAPETLAAVLKEAFEPLEHALRGKRAAVEVRERGTVVSVGRGVARVAGLEGARSEELLAFPGGVYGIAFNLDPGSVGAILLGESPELAAGSDVRRTGRVVDVPVGDALLGRVVDAIGRPLDGKGPIGAHRRRPVEREAPPIMDRLPVTVPLQTGLKVVDALIPIGRGQRELILGDRQTGKTSIAVDAIINQRDTEVRSVYCSVGQRDSSVARVASDLEKRGALEQTVLVVASGEEPAGMRFIAPYAAMAMGEYFMERGEDALVVFDDLTQHARAYRELSLLLRRPPGREAYPGDIFFIHARLLERSTHLGEERGGGSLTALPIIETEAQNVSAYIPTNLISITDGQIYVSPALFHQGAMPAVDVGKSVSRVGGKTQLAAYRAVAGDLRLSYSQFVELEKFARFSTRLDEETKRRLQRGRRVREVLKQPLYEPVAAPEQIAVLHAVNAGVLDAVPLDMVAEAERRIRAALWERLPALAERVLAGERLGDRDRKALREVSEEAVRGITERR